MDILDLTELINKLEACYIPGKGYQVYLARKELLLKNGIEVKNQGHRQLGRCYVANYFDVCSKQELPDSFITYLRGIGMLGYGQEFQVNKKSLQDGTYVVECEACVDSSD